jgi:membrane protease YdiL (CAAX protease family)
MNPFLAEMLTQGGSFWSTSQFGGSSMIAGLVFLSLLCAGVVADLFLTVFILKRPIRETVLLKTLEKKALPGRDVLAVFLVCLALYMLASVAYAVFFGSVEMGPQMLFFQTLVFHLPALLFIAVMIRGKGEFRLFQKPVKKTVQLIGLSVPLYLAVLPVIWFYSLLYQFFLNQMGYPFHLQDIAYIFRADASWLVRLGLFAVAGIAAPVFEEVLFRGILLPWVVRRTGLRWGIGLVSLFFAAMHLHLPSVLPLFLLSGFFCVAYARTGSLWVPIGMHVLFNTVSVALLILMG